MSEQDAELTSAEALENGAWVSGYTRTRRQRAAHFYPQGERFSICMRGDFPSPETIRDDPHGYRRHCQMCETLLAAYHSAVASEDAPIIPSVVSVIAASWDNTIEIEGGATSVGFRVTRAMGTRDGVARFVVVGGSMSETQLKQAIGWYLTTAESVEFVAA